MWVGAALAVAAIVLLVVRGPKDTPRAADDAEPELVIVRPAPDDPTMRDEWRWTTHRASRVGSGHRSR
jgi:hypothetical protein